MEYFLGIDFGTTGVRLIIINNEPTDFDPIADLVIHEQIGKVFSD